MKVSVNWLKQFTDIDISVDELVEKIGAQLGAVEEVSDLGKKYEGIIIADVVSCEKHANADKLSVCWIDDGGVAKGVERNEKGLVQVVCGAPNVREGLSVVWLPPGVTVPSSVDKDPFVLEARELRGVVSNGMLASASELAIGEDHSGIVEVELEVAPGTLFAEAYQLNDYIIDIENKMFTHRPDCFGILGVAREVAGIQQKAFVSPVWYAQALDRIKPGKTKLPITVKNQVPELVPRFMAITMAGIITKSSPFMLQTFLARVGLRPINNIVDITNYLMVLTGQPTHAYDADKLAKYGDLSLETRLSRKGDKLKLLNGKELKLEDNTTILITSNDKPVGIGGVMGGADTEVDETTKNIVIECANFDMYSIRRASMKHGLFTDAVTRFNKGQSPLQNDRILEEAVAMVQSFAGGHVASKPVDVQSNSVSKKHDSVHGLIATQASFINERLGLALSPKEIAALLTNVEFDVQVNGSALHVTAPFWRTDIEIQEDIVEEVGRLYGYDRLPLVLPERDLTPVTPDQQLAVKSQLRQTLSRAGANEVLTYGFVHGDLLNKTGQDSKLAFRLTNALSPDLQYYRLSMTPSLLEKVHPNIKAGYGQFALFELGKTHSKSEIADDGLPKEFDRLALTLALDSKTAKQTTGAAYYAAKQYLETAYGTDLRYVPLTENPFAKHKMFSQLLAPFEPQRSAIAYKGEKLVGVVGEYKASVKRTLKLPDYCAGFEAFLSLLVDEQFVSEYVAVSRFPKVEQDISLRVSANVSYQEVQTALADALNENSLGEIVSNLQPLDIYQKQGDDRKHLSFRYSVASYVRTLTAEEVNNLLDKAAGKLKDSLSAERI